MNRYGSAEEGHEGQKNRAMGILIVADAADADDIKRFLTACANCTVLGMIGRRESPAKRVAAIKPDVVIIESALPGLAWATAVSDIKRGSPVPAVIVISRVHSEADLLSAFREGADAFILKTNMGKRLLPALQAVRTGGIYYPQDEIDIIREHMRYLELGAARHVVDFRDGLNRLTVREKEIFPLLADGKSIKEVARILGISPKTVESHKYNIMKKLNFKTMSDWTKAAVMKDLIPL